MPIVPANPPSGSELIQGSLDNTYILLTRQQVVTLLTLTEVPTPVPYARADGPTPEARLHAVQGAQEVAFTRAQFVAYLASTSAPDAVPALRSVSMLTGRERLRGQQGLNLVGFDVSEVIDFRDNTNLSNVGANVLTFSTGEPLQFSNGQYLELAA